MEKKIFNIALFIYSIMFVCYNSIIGYFFENWLERGEAVVGVLLAIFLLYALIKCGKDDRIAWLKKNIIVFIYFAVRAVTLYKTHFDYSTLRTVFFEGIYLLILCNLVLDGGFIKKYVVKLLIYFNLALNVINVGIYWYTQSVAMTSGINEFLIKFTCYDSISQLNYSTMYVNPNTFGLMTAFAMIMAFCVFTKNMTTKKAVLLGAFEIFSLYCVYISECRSAVLALAAALVCWLIASKIKLISRKAVTTLCLACSVLVVVGLFGFIQVNQDTGLYYFTESEVTIDSLSSARYSIWKSGFNAHKEDAVLGVGSLTREISLRNDYLEQQHNYYIGGEPPFKKTVLGPHNGYYAMMWCTGFIGFALFCIILWQKIRRSKSLNGGLWYIGIVFILVANLFEAATIVSRLFLVLYMFLILEMGDEEDNASLLEVK